MRTVIRTITFYLWRSGIFFFMLSVFLWAIPLDYIQLLLYTKLLISIFYRYISMSYTNHWNSIDLLVSWIQTLSKCDVMISYGFFCISGRARARRELTWCNGGTCNFIKHFIAVFSFKSILNRTCEFTH